jgi:anaerobic magnesium-protoporphyrin IX monomethyl ester cyclase
VALMGNSGCVRISVGLETLERGAQAGLPKLKRKSSATLQQVAAWCSQAGVELNCFVILGLPGDTSEGAHATIATVRALGARIRPTLYTPYQDMREDMDEVAVASFDRQLPPLTRVPPEGVADIYPLLFGVEASPTQVMNRIAPRA